MSPAAGLGRSNWYAVTVEAPASVVLTYLTPLNGLARVVAPGRVVLGASVVALKVGVFAANTPTFNATTDAPSTTLPGATTLANPFKGVKYVNTTEAGASTVTAYQLLRPNPAAGDINLNTGDGKTFFYSLITKVEKRFNNGFSVLQSFT